MEPGEDTEVSDDVMCSLRETDPPLGLDPGTRIVRLLGIFALTCAILLGSELIVLFVHPRISWWASRAATIVLAGVAVTSMAYFVSRRLEHMRGSEHRFQQLFQQAGDAILLVEFRDGLPYRLLEANEAACAMLGYTEDEMRSKPISEIGVPKNLTQLVTELTDRGHVTFEMTMRAKDGHEVAVENHAHMFDLDGRAVILSINRDLTERKAAEAALRDSEQKFRMIFENASDAIILVEMTPQCTPARIFEANEAAYRMLGYTKEELAALSIADISDPSEWESFPAIDAQLRKNGQAAFDIVHIAKDGARIQCEVGIRIVELGGRKASLAIVRDVTARKSMEEELRWKTAFLEAQVDSSIDGVLVVDSQARRILVNRRFAQIWGFSEDILDNKDDSVLLEHALDRLKRPEQFYEKVMYLYDHPEESSWDELEFEDGTVLDRYSAPVLGKADGHHYGRIWTFRDITERKRAEQALAMRAADLARSNADLQHFAYVISHDLQEPLRMVSSYLQLLSRRYAGRLDQKADEFIGFAVDGAARMSGLIEGLLAYSRVGVRGKELVPVECETVFNDALANLQVSIEESSAVITHDPLPVVVGDDNQLVQLLQNLIGNAIKFHRDEPPRIHVSVKEHEGNWVFSVQDDGIGIAPEHRERIFGIFERLHTQSEYPGSGMGLAICRRIVERHGGRIWVESEGTAGSTFYFTLPEARHE